MIVLGCTGEAVTFNDSTGTFPSLCFSPFPLSPTSSSSLVFRIGTLTWTGRSGQRFGQVSRYVIWSCEQPFCCCGLLCVFTHPHRHPHSTCVKSLQRLCLQSHPRAFPHKRVCRVPCFWSPLPPRHHHHPCRFVFVCRSTPALDLESGLSRNRRRATAVVVMMVVMVKDRAAVGKAVPAASWPTSRSASKVRNDISSKCKGWRWR